MTIRDPYRGLVMTVSNTVNGVPVSAYHYTYDALGRVVSRDADFFGYNSCSELISAVTGNNVGHYAYDGIGNALWTDINDVGTVYHTNPLNQYTNILRASAPPREPQHDLDGNLLNLPSPSGRGGGGEGWLCQWDGENRLVAVYSNAACVVSNAYDHQSRRVLKVTPVATHTFLYDGWNLVQETITTSTSTTTNHYIWGKDLSGTMQGAGGVGGLLAVCVDNSYYFPLYDNNGNITAYVDESGIVVAEYVYDAFGNTISQSGAMANTFSHRFSTKYYDTETGLYYYGYRFYSPMLMRWMNRDPMEEQGGINLYIFTSNNSVMSFDYIGLRRIFYSTSGEEIGRDRSWEIWLTTKFIQGPNGNVKWCGRRFWRVRSYDKHYLPGSFSGVEEKWDDHMQTFYDTHKNTSWFYKNVPYGYLFALGVVLENSPQAKPWDYKRSLDAEKWYIFKNTAYRFDSIGNITWGAIMKSYGFPRQFALMGAGAQQLRDDYINFKGGYLSFWQFVMKHRNVYGDEDRDGEAITEGYGWNP